MKLFLLLDYDGTLTPIRDHPKLAQLSLERKLFLRKLVQQQGVKVAVISGRKLSVVKKLVGIRNIVYVGNHGFEIEAGGRRWLQPAAKRTVPLLKKIKKALKRAARYRGTFVEDKGLSLSVHYRLLAHKRVPAFLNDLTQTLKFWQNDVRVTHGKKVLEIRPPVDWDKGKAVKWLIKNLKLGEYRPVYIGDDATDEDAFRVLSKKGMAIHVGGGSTLAKQRIKDVAGVYRYLRKLVNNESKITF